ncbi:MAG: sec-independent protein translocase protein TatB [Campylobacterota bacterium]|nr:sec-independent protein translocase protein TatB [Campylobacterota bacterium]
MFGMGLGEIILIIIAAIIFLGPDKLPETMVNIAKFFKSVKKNITQARDSLEEELNVAQMKNEMLDYKEKIQKTTDDLYSSTNNESREIKEIFSDLKKDENKKNQ